MQRQAARATLGVPYRSVARFPTIDSFILGAVLDAAYPERLTRLSRVSGEKLLPATLGKLFACFRSTAEAA